MEVGDGQRDTPDAMQPSGAEASVAQGDLDELFGGRSQRCQSIGLRGAEPGIGLDAALTIDEIDSIKILTDEVASLKAENAALVAENDKVVAELTKDAAEAAVKAENRVARSGGRTKNRIKKLKVERTDLLAQLGSLGYRLNDVTGVSAEGLELIGKLAINRIRIAAEERGERMTLDAVVKDVLADLNNEEVTARDIHAALDGRSPKATKKAESMAKEHVREIRAQAALMVKIDETERGITAPKKTRGQQSTEVKRLQRQLTALRNNVYQSVREAAKIERAVSTINQLQDHAANILLAEANAPGPRTKVEASPELKALNETIAGLRAEFRIDEQIADLQEQIRTGEIAGPKKRGGPKGGESMAAKRAALRELRRQAVLMVKIEKGKRGVFEGRKTPAERSKAVDLLQQQFTELRRMATKGSRDEARTAKAMETLADLQAQLDGHYRNLKEPRKAADTTPELEAIKEKLGVLRRVLSTEDALSDIQEQLRTGDFKRPEKRVPTYTSPELERNQIALRKARQQWRIAIAEMERGSVSRTVVKTAEFLRTMKATADMSGTLRQGLILSVMRPGVALHAFGRSFKSFYDQNTYEQIDNAMREHPNHFYRERAELELTDIDGTLNEREESFQSAWAESIPGVASVVRGSNRSMTVTLNLIRVAAFDEFIEANPNATLDEMKAWANWVNVATGRGRLGSAGAIGTTLSIVFFAPRFALSRIQVSYKAIQYWHLPRVRNAILKDQAGTLAVGMLMLALAHLAGFSVGLNPRDPDFGKIRIGDTRINIWFGLQQPVRIVLQLGLIATDRMGLTGRHLTATQKAISPMELIGRFGEFKLSPLITTPIELLTGENVVGEARTPSQTAARAVAPIILEGIYDAQVDYGINAAAITGVGEFLGLGIQSYPDSQGRVRRKAQRLLSEGESDAASAIMEEWNAANPERRIMSVKAAGDTLKLPTPPKATGTRRRRR